MIDAVKVVQIKTKAPAHVVVRNSAGRKLFDMWLPGVSIGVAVSKEAEIKVTPDRRKK